MYQRSAPAKAPDISDVHAVVRELAGVLVRQPAPLVPMQPTREMSPAAQADSADLDDAKMPIPSTWRDPSGMTSTAAEVAPWRTGLIGLMVGLCLTLPTVLWLTGNLSTPLAWLGWGRGQVASAQSGMAPAVAAEVAWPASFGRGSTEPVASDGSASPPAPGAESPASITTTAELLISGGDVVLARNLLERHAAAGQVEILFALAETYDPNMLAAWGVRDLRADASRARSLYERALAGGIDKARGRLQGLQ